MITVPISRSDLQSWIFSLLLIAIVCATTWTWQPQISVDDGYGFLMRDWADSVDSFRKGEPITGIPPHVYRIGTPWLVSLLPLQDNMQGFRIVGLVSSIIACVLFELLLRRFINNPVARFCALALFATHWLAPLRLASFAPVCTDYTAVAIRIIALLAAERASRTDSIGVIIFFTITAALAAAQHESNGIICLVYMLARSPVQWNIDGERSARVLLGNFWRNLPRCWWLPILAYVLSIGLVHRLVKQTADVAQGTGEGLYYLEHPLANLYEKSLLAAGYMWFIVFGPSIVLLVLNWRGCWDFLRTRQYLCVYLIFFPLMAIVGGTDTERILSWSSPVVYLLIALCIQELSPRLRKAWIATGILIVTQLISQRIFWVTPDAVIPLTARSPVPILTMWGSDFSLNWLWSQPTIMDNRISAIACGRVVCTAFIEYVLLSIVLVALLLWQAPIRTGPAIAPPATPVSKHGIRKRH